MVLYIVNHAIIMHTNQQQRVVDTRIDHHMINHKAAVASVAYTRQWQATKIETGNIMLISIMLNTIFMYIMRFSLKFTIIALMKIRENESVGEMKTINEDRYRYAFSANDDEPLTILSIYLCIS